MDYRTREDYKNASDEGLRAALRSDDLWAGAELLRRQRLGITDLDKMRAQRNEEKFHQEIQNEIEEYEEFLKEK